MLNAVQAIILGILQGITEWLPVSSSGHLAVAQHYLGLDVPIAFDVMLHVATLLVILVFFRTDIQAILKALGKRDFASPHGKLLLYVIIGSIPTAIIGFTFRYSFESMYASMLMVGCALVVTGFILALGRLGGNGKRKLGWWRSVLVGAAQGLAVAPGISRSGATIGTSLFLGLKREQAIRFSFLLAVPAILGAMIFQLDGLVVSGIGIDALAGGFLASLVVGYLSLKLVIRLVMDRRFSWFAVYCIGLGVVLVLLNI